MDETATIERASQLGGIAYLAELVMRLYAHPTNGLEKYTHAPSTELENEFFKYLGMAISEEEKMKICDCRDFRNKLLHTEWWKNSDEEEYKKRFGEVKNTVALIRRLSGLNEMAMLSDDPKEIDWNSLDFVERYVFYNYRNVAIASTAYEIVMRNFASQFPEIQSIAYDETNALEDVQASLASHLHFSPETVTLVENCRKIRNKILHCDFFAAKKVAMDLAPNKVSQSGNVLVLKAEKNWDSEFVSNSTRKGAGPLGWALEGLSSGATDVAFESLSIVTRKIYTKDFVFDRR